MTVDLIAAGTCFIDKAKLSASTAKLADRLVQRIQIAADGAVESDLAVSAVIGQGDINRIFVYIESNKNGRMFHDLPPWLWLCNWEPDFQL